MIKEEGLKREIGLWGLISNSINITIGAGIFILPVIVAERLGSGSIWPYAICGLLMMMIMLCFTEAGTRITCSGGAYSYIEIAFGRYAGFLTTNIFIFGGAVMANAAVANGLADTLGYFFPFFKLQITRVTFFTLLFGGLAYLNVIGVAKSILLVKVTTIAKLTPLLLIALAGLFFIDPSNLATGNGNSVTDIGEMSLILLFAFVGAETALNVSGEIKNPKTTIPKGIIISVLAVALIYTLIQITVQGMLGSSVTSYKDAPLAEVARRMIGPVGATIVLIGASFSMFGNLSGMVLNMPRVLFAASRDNVIPPKALSKVHPEYKTPYLAIISYAILGFIFATAGEFRQLAMLSSASYLIIYLGVTFSVIKFRMREERQDEAFRVPGGYLVPVISSLSIIWVLSNLPFIELRAMVLFILLLTLIYFVIKFVRKSKPKPPIK
jgi:amino acid transporter